jgi:hypothetical protein
VAAHKAIFASWTIKQDSFAQWAGVPVDTWHACCRTHWSKRRLACALGIPLRNLVQIGATVTVPIFSDSASGMGFRQTPAVLEIREV